MTLATEQDAFAVENTVKKAIKEVAPKFDKSTLRMKMVRKTKFDSSMTLH
jgi:hypothetical protein